MKKLLVINFFPAFVPPRSGGELRYFNMYRGLSQYYDVTLLSPTYENHKEEIVVHSDTFREYRVPKESIHSQLHSDIAKEKICSEISALVCSLSAETHNRYHDLYQQLYPEADIIIHESPYMLSYDLYFGIDSKPRVYNSYNLEIKLLEQMWKGPNAEKYLVKMRDAERALVQKCDLVFATSQEERAAFALAYHVDRDQIRIAPNGIDVSLYEKERQRKRPDERRKVFFIGSAHPPNVEAVSFLTKIVAPACPEIDFHIAGKCCNDVKCGLKNVHLLGLIDEEQKDDLFTTSDAAVNPMFSGAGTNLKTLEFLSAGIPMLSTYVGVRGLDLEEGVHYVHAEKDDFVQKLKELLQNERQQETLSRKGKEFINSRYSWEKICDDVHQAIETLPAEREKTGLHTILAVNDYSVDRPSAGGEIRIHHLLKHLSKYNRIIYVCLNQDEVKKQYLTENFLHISLPKTEEHLAREAEINRQHWISADDIVAGTMIHENALYMQAVQTIGALADLIILEQPYMVDAIQGLPDRPVIYESQNFEYQLKRELLAQHPMKERLVAEAKRLEFAALERAKLVVSCSQDEVEPLRQFAGRDDLAIEVIRNGVAFTERKYDYSAWKSLFDGRPLVVFVGSGHTPNVDAANFIVSQLAPSMPDVVFVLIGTVGDAVAHLSIPQNVLLMGKLEEKYKNFLLFAADVAVNPMEQGAGSNLKLAEYFAYEIPTVTTAFGARGYEIENGCQAVICERAEFARNIRWLLEHPAEREEMVRSACDYAKRELSWESLADQYARLIDVLMGKKRLLTVTYRYNTPPRGGAEVYLEEVLRRIAARGNYVVDVVTTEVGDILNQFQYACSYTKDKASTGALDNGLTVFKFPVDELTLHEKWEKCSEIYKTAMEESVKIARNFVDRYERPLLMGGWHYPEVRADGVYIWASGCAELFVRGVSSLCLSGHANRRQKIRLLLDGNQLLSTTVHGDFLLNLEKICGDVVTIESVPFQLTDQDPRPLSVCLSEIAYRNQDQWETIDFTFNYKQFLRQSIAGEYVSELIHIANMRESKIDKLFYEARGPVSHKLQEWLEKNIEKYDVVLGHSIPFNTLIDAQGIAKKHEVPCVVLPHFHMEDEFYHWRSFYQALSGADCVLSFPVAAKEMFFDKIRAKTKNVSGGGINPEEFDETDSSEFRRQYTDKRPFLLVLGRKAGGKNYQWVIDAVEELNRRGTAIHMVMIGRDDDKIPVESPHVTYLGEQSRAAVIGALKSCEFVVNMSESESFGIVILEAWLAGKTIIANRRCVAFEELIDHEVDGILSTHEDLADSIACLMVNPNRDKMAERGRKKADRFSWEQLSRDIEKILGETEGMYCNGKTRN